MGKRLMIIFLLASLLILPILLMGCGDNDPGPFILGKCRLNDTDCQLQ